MEQKDTYECIHKGTKIYEGCLKCNGEEYTNCRKYIGHKIEPSKVEKILLEKN